MLLNYTGKNGELNFEKDLVSELIKVGWEKEVIKEPTEDDLIENWRKIIYDNNKVKLNDIPLSGYEMGQIMEYIKLNCNTPVKANLFINGKNVCVKRDSDSKDTEHAGKEVYLDIFDPVEIAGGRTRYQIVEQPKFDTSNEFNNRRGDVLLLINGMPVIHIELKASGVSVEQATNQIQKYAKEGVFTGLFSLIQVFFAITPEDALYFANPGDYLKYNSAFFFHWGNRTNEIIKDWRQLCKGESSILSIPEAHQLIGYYTVASKDIDTLMVVRSYQYHAIKAILQRVKRQKWGNHEPLGGYVWCTTGGGKTLTSFKAGQLIFDKSLADKVVFVVDRVELNNQSLEEYNSFQREGEEVQETNSANELFVKLKSNKPKDALIVTSIQKLNRINDDAARQKKSDLEYIKNKRIVFIIDEAHRSQFGSMHERVKDTFTNALYIGFTGTPIFSENDKDGFTTESVFGKCLAVYSIADGIRDNNVLGFDPKAIKTYKDEDLKRVIALDKCNAKDEEEAKSNPEKWKIYRKYKMLGMTTTFDSNGNEIKGVEDLLPPKQYDCDNHRQTVVDDILTNWSVLSVGEKGTRFHAILATTSITEECAYYKLFKDKKCNLKVTALFDPNIDNNGKSSFDKQDALIEIVDDYNRMFNQHFDRDSDPNFKKFKKDIISRLAHKKQYKRMNIKGDNEILDLVIVVDQLLTGFDSKFVNTLYLDKVIENDNIIQAISRTNRVYDNEEKPFGIFRFYRKPYTMQDNLKEALRLYCEGDISGVIVKNIEENIEEIKSVYPTILKIFKDNNIDNFCRLPDKDADCQKFKKEFLYLKTLMNSIKLQGFKWNADCNTCIKSDDCPDKDDKEKCIYKLPYTEDTYKVLEMRFADLAHRNGGGNASSGFGFDLASIKSEMAMEKVDVDYLESHFRKVIPIIISNDISETEKDDVIKKFEKELPKLSEIHQKYAREIISDIRQGTLIVEDEKTLMQYICEYIERDLDKTISDEAGLFGLNKQLLKEIYRTSSNERELNEHNRFERLKSSANLEKVIAKKKKKENKPCSEFSARVKLDTELKNFILSK